MGSVNAVAFLDRKVLECRSGKIWTAAKWCFKSADDKCQWTTWLTLWWQSCNVEQFSSVSFYMCNVQIVVFLLPLLVNNDEYKTAGQRTLRTAQTVNFGIEYLERCSSNIYTGWPKHSKPRSHLSMNHIKAGQRY